jgi:hypothetical protein
VLRDAEPLPLPLPQRRGDERLLEDRRREELGVEEVVRVAREEGHPAGGVGVQVAQAGVDAVGRDGAALDEADQGVRVKVLRRPVGCARRSSRAGATGAAGRCAAAGAA